MGQSGAPRRYQPPTGAHYYARWEPDPRSRGAKRTNRAVKTLTEWASVSAEPWGPVPFYPEPLKMGLYRSATRPSVRCNPVSCQGYFHAWRESQYHRKQSWQAGHERTHSCNTLVGNPTPNPIKEPPTAVFFIAPNGASARPAGRCEHTSFQPVKSPVFSARKGA